MTGLVCHRCGYTTTVAGAARCPTDQSHLIDADEHARAPRDAFLGTTLGGRYPILGILGSGGMGAVYRSSQPIVDRPVAIKVIQPRDGARTEARDADAERRFLNEAKIIATLSHPGIVTLHDFGIESVSVVTMNGLFDGPGECSNYERPFRWSWKV